jgi:hypothetical protein
VLISVFLTDKEKSLNTPAMSRYFLIPFLLLLTLSYSCKKETEDPPPPVSEACADVNSAFNSEVFPLLVNNCANSGCHSNASASAGLRFTDYNQIKQSIELDQQGFLNSINFAGSDSTIWMPRTIADAPATIDNKLPQAAIDKIECWIERGMPND